MICVAFSKDIFARIQKVSPLVKWTHCCIHRKVLAACRMPSKMKTVLDKAVKIVNFIKAQVFARTPELH
jgi:hypothetical protein